MTSKRIEPVAACDELRVWLSAQKEHRLAHGPAWNEAGRADPKQDGTQMAPSTLKTSGGTGWRGRRSIRTCRLECLFGLLGTLQERSAPLMASMSADRELRRARAPRRVAPDRPGPRPDSLVVWFAALALALPYPVLKTWWALGGSFGLRWPGACGLAGSFALRLPAVPWLLAAALSLLLMLTPRWLPRRLLLVAGWSATVVAMIGPVACWSLVDGLIRGDADFGGVAGWVFALFYSCVVAPSRRVPVLAIYR